MKKDGIKVEVIVKILQAPEMSVAAESIMSDILSFTSLWYFDNKYRFCVHRNVDVDDVLR